jgi:hypothetical protein
MIRVIILALVCSSALAQQSTPNLITQQWSGATVGLTSEGYGITPASLPKRYSILFGYDWGRVSQVIAIDKALTGTGIKVSGYNYSWEYYNFGWARGSLTSQITLTNIQGEPIEKYSYNMNSYSENDWVLFQGKQDFKTQYDASSLKTLSILFSGKGDLRSSWYFGPQLRNVSLSLNYTLDPCLANPLYSTSCKGYNNIVTQQQILQTPKSTETLISQPTTTSTSPADVAAVIPLVPSQQSSPAVQQQALTQAVETKQEIKEQPKQQERKAVAVKSVGSAKSMEDQMANQSAVISAMGSTPGFNSYTTASLKDALFYKPFEIYKQQQTVDNVRLLRGMYGPSEFRHQQLINSQYK